MIEGPLEPGQEKFGYRYIYSGVALPEVFRRHVDDHRFRAFTTVDAGVQNTGGIHGDFHRVAITVLCADGRNREAAFAMAQRAQIADDERPPVGQADDIFLAQRRELAQPGVGQHAALGGAAQEVALAEERGLSAGKLIHPTRLAVTGRGASPGLFEVLDRWLIPRGLRHRLSETARG